MLSVVRENYIKNNQVVLLKESNIVIKIVINNSNKLS